MKIQIEKRYQNLFVTLIEILLQNPYIRIEQLKKQVLDIHSINEETLNWLWKFQIQAEPINREEARQRQRLQLVHESAAGLGFQGASVGEESDIQRASKERSRKKQPIRVERKVGPNEPCPCGSGKKYKKCHGAIQN